MTTDLRSYTFDWRRDEHARVTSLLFREQLRSGIWRLGKWIIALVVILGAMLCVATAMLGDLASTLRLAPLLVIVGGLTLAFPALIGRLQAWRVQRNDPNVGHPFTHMLDHSGLHVGMRTVNAELKWSGMYMVRETPDMFLFYYNRRTAYFLPKRALGSLEESAGLAQWIRTQLPSSVPYVAP